jgi:hypothetical protein
MCNGTVTTCHLLEYSRLWSVLRPEICVLRHTASFLIQTYDSMNEIRAYILIKMGIINFLFFFFISSSSSLQVIFLLVPFSWQLVSPSVSWSRHLSSSGWNAIHTLIWECLFRSFLLNAASTCCMIQKMSFKLHIFQPYVFIWFVVLWSTSCNWLDKITNAFWVSGGSNPLDSWKRIRILVAAVVIIVMNILICYHRRLCYYHRRLLYIYSRPTTLEFPCVDLRRLICKLYYVEV